MSRSAKKPRPAKPRVALYARVSTRQHGQDVETQLGALREYARARKWRVVDEYADTGWSGAKERRPELDRLMHDARVSGFDVVLVARFDRFARSVKHLLAALEEFSQLGVDFVSLGESIDTSTPAGRLVFTVLAAVAELERELIRERVRLGIARARRRGKRLGRRPRKIADEDAMLRAVERKGATVTGVAREFGIPRSTLRLLIKRRKNDADGRNAPLRGRRG